MAIYFDLQAKYLRSKCNQTKLIVAPLFFFAKKNPSNKNGRFFQKKKQLLSHSQALDEELELGTSKKIWSLFFLLRFFVRLFGSISQPLLGLFGRSRDPLRCRRVQGIPDRVKDLMLLYCMLL